MRELIVEINHHDTYEPPTDQCFPKETILMDKQQEQSVLERIQIEEITHQQIIHA